MSTRRFPQTEAEAVTCQHGNRVWFGHECGLCEDMSHPEEEPAFLEAMRQAAKQRPRTQFVKIRWSNLQLLLQQRDMLWALTSDETKATIKAAQAHVYAYEQPAGYNTPRGPR